MKITWLLLFFVIVCISLFRHVKAATNYRPVVLMHGLNAYATDLNETISWIENDFPGIYICNVEIGNGKADSMFMEINKQVESFAKTVKADPKLQQGFNLIGHSQGGLIIRAYVERYNDPPVHNLISWVGPHAGVYGIPGFNALCPDADCPWFDFLFDKLLNGTAPKPWVQESFSFAAYWKSPNDYAAYLKDNIFLADINNERDVKNATYKKNMVSLNKFLMVYSTTDKVIVPDQSPWFYFYNNTVTDLVPMRESAQYIGDWLGLQTLDHQGKIDMQSVPCGHVEITKTACGREYYSKYTSKYLNNTL